MPEAIQEHHLPNNKRRIERKENYTPLSARLRPRDSLRHPQLGNPISSVSTVSGSNGFTKISLIGWLLNDLA
jgi:hypothetical protein